MKRLFNIMVWAVVLGLFSGFGTSASAFDFTGSSQGWQTRGWFQEIYNICRPVSVLKASRTKYPALRGFLNGNEAIFMEIIDYRIPDKTNFDCTLPYGIDMVYQEFYKDIQNETGWQGFDGFTFYINTEDGLYLDGEEFDPRMDITGITIAGFVRVLDKNYNPVLCPANFIREPGNGTYKVYLSTLTIPRGSTIQGVGVRVYFECGRNYLGSRIYLDDVEPIFCLKLRFNGELPFPTDLPFH